MFEQHRHILWAVFIALFLVQCGGPSSLPGSETEGSNPATRSTPGFAIISGNTGTGGVTVTATNSLGESFSTVTSSEDSSTSSLTTENASLESSVGAFSIEVRPDLAYQILFLVDGEPIDLEFDEDSSGSKTTTTFFLPMDNDFDFGEITFDKLKGRARPEKNPLSAFDRDRDGQSDLFDTDDDDDGIPDHLDEDSDGDGVEDDTGFEENEEEDLDFNFFLKGKTIRGDLTVEAKKVIIVGAKIRGRLKIRKASEVILKDIRVDSNMKLREVSNFELSSSQIHEDLSLIDSENGFLSGNEISGDLIIINTIDLTLSDDNEIGGEIIRAGEEN